MSENGGWGVQVVCRIFPLLFEIELTELPKSEGIYAPLHPDSAIPNITVIQIENYATEIIGVLR